MFTEEEVDNRLFERFQARFPAKFKDARDDFGSVLNLRDASAFGMRLATKEKLYLNDIVTIEIRLPDGHAPMVLKGEVVWSKSTTPASWEAGIKLNKIDLVHMSRLYRYVHPRLPAE